MRIDFYWFNVGAPAGYSTGVALLSQELKDHGHEVRLCQVDERVALPWDLPALVEHSVAFRPDVVAVSLTSAYAHHTRQLVAALHEALPRLRVVVGGVHPTLAPEEVISWPGVSALGRGECDGRLAEFIDGWAAGEEAPPISNFWVRRADGTILRNPMHPLPTLEGRAPINEDLDLRKLVRANRGLIDVAVTRGCPYRCTYCHNGAVAAAHAADLGEDVVRRTFCRRRSVDDAMAEVRRLVELAGDAVKVLSFDDDTLVVDRKWFIELATRIRAEFGLPYLAMLTMNRVDDEIIRVLGETRCLLARFGVESGAPRLLRRVLGRTPNVDRVRHVFGRLREHGVNTRAYVMVGIPTETRDDVEATFRLCGEARTDSVRPSFVIPYPGTKIEAYCREHELILPGVHTLSYSDASPLRWPPEHELLLRKIMHIHPWLLSAALPGSPVAATYRRLADEALAMDAAEWSRPDTAVWVRTVSLELDREQRLAGIPHYVSPFLDRRDAAFLIRPERPNPFPNVDDAWPPDAPWHEEPVPSARTRSRRGRS